jgi:excisionase family DNA binding protein
MSEDLMLIRAGEAARVLSTSPETLRWWVRRGLLTPVKIGRSIYFEPSELERFVREGREKK